MKRFLDRITPAFIKNIQSHLLKNSPLAWQLQLPQIFWLWFLITLVTVPIPLLYEYNIQNQWSDTGVMFMIAAFIGVLQFLLFGYLLIRFNVTKVFGRRSFAQGTKEQLSYFLVMCLCLTNVILFPLIIYMRESVYMSEDQIRKEEIIYNNARYYFMDNENAYLYFPNDSMFVAYMEFEPVYSEKEEDYRSPDAYYSEVIKPMLKPYLKGDTGTYWGSAAYKRDSNGPKLYYIGSDYLKYYRHNIDNEEDSYKILNYPNNEKEGYRAQLTPKTDQQRLKEIKDFIDLYMEYQNRYNTTLYKSHDVHFQTPEQILEKYKANVFERCVTTDYIENYRGEEPLEESDIVENNDIASVHSGVIEAKYNKWRRLVEYALGAFFAALGFSMLLFLFKNVTLPQLIRTIVISGLMFLLSVLLVVVSNTRDFLPFHIPIVLFFTGVYFSLTSGSWKHFSQIKTVFVIISNLFLPFVPIFFYVYFYEYMHFWKFDETICKEYSDPACRAHREMMVIIMHVCIWGGIAVYLLFGSWWYKKVYEKIWSLPLHK